MEITSTWESTEKGPTTHQLASDKPTYSHSPDTTATFLRDVTVWLTGIFNVRCEYNLKKAVK